MRCCFHSFKDLSAFFAARSSQTVRFVWIGSAKVGGFTTPSKYFFFFFCGIYGRGAGIFYGFVYNILSITDLRCFGYF
jgi:hypothetical protein